MERPADPDRLSPDRAGYAAYKPVRPEIKRAIWGHIGHYVGKWVDASAPVLELGAGRCDFIGAVSASSKVALDVSQELLSCGDADIEKVVGDVVDLSRFDDSSFGTVLVSNLLEHLQWDEIDTMVAQTARVLRPGGHLIIINPNFRLAVKTSFDNYSHRTIHTDRSVAGYLRVREWDIVHIEGRFMPFTMHSRLSFGHKLVPLYLALPWRPCAGQLLAVARRPALVR